MEDIYLSIHDNQLGREPYKGFLNWFKNLKIQDAGEYKTILLMDGKGNGEAEIVISNLDEPLFKQMKNLIEVRYRQSFSHKKFDAYYDMLEKILENNYYIPESIGVEINGRIIARNQVSLSCMAIVVQENLIKVALALINQMVMLSASFQALDNSDYINDKDIT